MEVWLAGPSYLDLQGVTLVVDLEPVAGAETTMERVLLDEPAVEGVGRVALLPQLLQVPEAVVEVTVSLLYQAPQPATPTQ
jgi:hypothetical protein